MDNVAKLYLKKIRESGEVKCCICGKEILNAERFDLEYVRSKQKEDLFMHKECFNTLLK